MRRPGRDGDRQRWVQRPESRAPRSRRLSRLGLLIGLLAGWAPAAYAAVAAQPDSLTLLEDGSVTITASQLLANDVATDGEPLQIASWSTPSHGALDVAADSASAVYTPAADFNGSDSFDYTLTAGGTATVTITVTPVDDRPIARSETRVVQEGTAPVRINVLANDYLAEQPTTIVRAGITVDGIDGFTESPPSTLIDALGNPVTTPNGQVAIIDNEIEYQPKAWFYGTDWFTYVIEDDDGDSASARVTIEVTPVNDPPQGVSERRFTVSENGRLDVPASNGLLSGAFDPDNFMVDASGNPVIVQTLRVELLTQPLSGMLQIDAASGAFTFEPAVNFTGSVSFTWRLDDGEALSVGDAYTVWIDVLAVASPPEPPAPGQVSIDYDLANMPLEQSTGVPPNVLVMMDDSGSMDWSIAIAGSDEGVMELSNVGIANQNRVQTGYSYLWPLPSSLFPQSSTYGHILPTPEGLAAAGASYPENIYGVWRARNHLYNAIYYNPAVRYAPWMGQDDDNVAFADADPRQIRLDPASTRTRDQMDITRAVSYRAYDVPRWRPRGGSTNLTDSVYIPHYYTTNASPPLAADDQHDKVEIREGMGPLPGGLFPGGPLRSDCAVLDDDPSTCTYDEEIRNFANWFQYYRSRVHVGKGGLGKVVAEVQNVRVGVETINETTSEPVREMNDRYTEGNKKRLLDTIYEIEARGSTPLRQSLRRAGDILGCDIGNNCPRLPPPAGFCQQNFALVVTDGYWNGGAGITGNRDGDNNTSFDGGRYADTYAATLADTAMHFYERDLHPDYENRVPVSARDVLGAPSGTFPDNDPFMHQHMKTYTIGFGVSGTIDPATIPVDPTQPFAWPDPFDGAVEKIDDLVHAAINGRGRNLSATNAAELQAALEAAFLEFTQAASSTSSAAFNSTSLEEGTLLYRGFYDLRYNTGELTATRVNSDGSLAGDPLWRASERLDPQNVSSNRRVIVSHDPVARSGIAFRHGSLAAGQQAMLEADQVEFLRGARNVESPLGRLRQREPRGGLLGDIVNSNPVFVGPPRSINRDQAPYPRGDLYSAFARDRANRLPVVYVGANDGMLHGFNARTGDEVFAYVPHKITDAAARFRNPLADFTSPFYQHRYFVDLSPRLNDAYLRVPGSTARAWRTILVGGLGAGGKGFFALDVTDPDAMYTSEAAARSSVLWEFTEADDTYPVDRDGQPLGGGVGAIRDPDGAPVKDLGYALSEPTIAMSNVRTADGQNEQKWVALFGNGPNSTAGIAKLFALFIEQGIDGWQSDDFVKVDTGRGVALPPHPLAGFPNALGTPAAVDTDLNGTVDVVYAGDRLGNLYRFDLSSADPTDWHATRLFTATSGATYGSLPQPILGQPLVVRNEDREGFMVIFGTGSYVSRDDARSDEIQSIYGIWDRGEEAPATAAPDTRDRRLVRQVLTNVWDDTLDPPVTRRVLSANPVEYTPQSCGSADCNNVDDEPGVYGWYVDLDPVRAAGDAAGLAPPDPQYPGERAIRRLLFRNGAVVTTTVLPALDDFSCYGTRPGSILLFDAFTGGDVGRPLIDFDNDGRIDEGDLITIGGVSFAAGVLFNQSDLDGSLVDLSTLTGRGDSDFLFVSGGRDTVAYLIESIRDRRTGRLSWQELEPME